MCFKNVILDVSRLRPGVFVANLTQNPQEGAWERTRVRRRGTQVKNNGDFIGDQPPIKFGSRKVRFYKLTLKRPLGKVTPRRHYWICLKDDEESFENKLWLAHHNFNIAFRNRVKIINCIIRPIFLENYCVKAIMLRRQDLFSKKKEN